MNTKLLAETDLARFPGLHITEGQTDARRWPQLGDLRTAAVYVAFALLALAIIGLHLHHFRGRPYRQDEAWIVHGALERYGAADIVQWVSADIHPPLWVMAANAWVDVFGQNELVTRYLSTLFTALSLALLFRLAADLTTDGSRAVALGAVFLIGTSAFFQFYSQEFRPYPALITCTLGTIWGFMRWVRRPNFRNALLFVGFGIAALYVHFFAVYVVAALAVFFVVFARWNPRLYLKAFGLFFAIGASYLGWLLPIVYALRVATPGGIDYGLKSSQETLALLWRYMSLQPNDVAELLLITSALILVRHGARRSALVRAPDKRFRFDPWWRQGFPLVVGVTSFVLAFGANRLVANLTQRELVILMPLAALFLAFGFAALPGAARLAVIVLLLPSALRFVDYEFPGPQADIAAYIAPNYQAGNPIILNVPYEPRQIAVLYYVQNRMNFPIPNDLIWQVLYPNPANNSVLPFQPAHLMNYTNGATLDKLREFLDTAKQDQVWYIETQGGNFYTAAIEKVLDQERYKVANKRAWKGNYTVVQYRRQAAAAGK